MKNIAVIGGAGFIGSHLCKELIHRNYKVRVIDQNKPKIDNIPFIQANIKDIDALRKALKGVDGVFHLAALVGVDSCLNDDNEVIQTNLKGTENVLDVCMELGVKKILFTSSSEVYGDGVKVPFSEDDDKVPKSTYGKAKLEAEKLLKQVSNNIDVRIVRYFNIYGIGQREDFVISRFCRNVLQGKAIQIYGDGSQVRCFTNVKDAVRGTVLAYEYPDSPYEVFNIANSRPITIKELAYLIYNLTKNEPKIQYIDFNETGVRPKSVEVFQRIPDVTKAKKLLHFEASISLEKGLKELIEHMESELFMKN